MIHAPLYDTALGSSETVPRFFSSQRFGTSHPVQESAVARAEEDGGNYTKTKSSQRQQNSHNLITGATLLHL